MADTAAPIVNDPSAIAASPLVFDLSGFSVRRLTRNNSAGWEYWWQGDSYFLALHDFQRTEGETQTDVTAPDRRRDLRGMMTFVPVGCRMWGWSLPQSSAQSVMILNFDATRMERELASKFLGAPSQPRVYFSNPSLRSTFEKLQRALTHIGSDAALYMETLCLLAALELCVIERSAFVREAQTIGALSRAQELKVRDFIEANLASDITLDDLAKIANLSRFHFLRAFKGATTETPYQFLLRQRIERARLLLQTRDLAISQVAALVGFKTSSHFTRAYRKRYGTAPSQSKCAT